MDGRQKNKVALEACANIQIINPEINDCSYFYYDLFDSTGSLLSNYIFG